MTAHDPQQPTWHDFQSFVRHVRGTCRRLNLPQATLAVLEREYVHRCIVLAEARAMNEIMEARERRAGRSLKAVAR